ncbi:RNA-binding protein [Candidatus Woesearchaeota archaeon]|nr:RNA-binding protein [Candidatus Woesearchaeota archaeon]
MQVKIMDKKKLKELKSRSNLLEPIIRIGKNGLSENVISEIKKLLKKRKFIKIKILNNCPADNYPELISQTIDKTGATLIKKTGHTFVLWKSK